MRNRKGWADPWRGCCGGGNPVAGCWVAELIEEGVAHSLNGRQPLRRSVFQKGRDEVDSLRGCLSENLEWRQYPSHKLGTSGKYLVEGMRLDLRELVLHVIGVHGADLFTGGRAQAP